MRKLVILAAVCVCLFASCKREALDCDYTILPRVQMYSGGVGNVPSDWTAYAYYGDEEEFYVGQSFDSIIMGQMWSRTRGEYVLCNVQAMQNDDGNIILPLHAPNSLVVVCAPEYRVFAWKNVTTTENLWELRIPIWLRVWRGANYKESWQFVFPRKE